MNRDVVIATLKANEGLLRARGVTRAALFGSTARGEAGPQSDLDIMLDIDPRKPVDLLAYCGIINAIEDMFVVSVDVSERVRLRPGVREAAERDALYAF
jgi:predicted nucleotidyltransferase